MIFYRLPMVLSIVEEQQSRSWLLDSHPVPVIDTLSPFTLMYNQKFLS